MRLRFRVFSTGRKTGPSSRAPAQMQRQSFGRQPAIAIGKTKIDILRADERACNLRQALRKKFRAQMKSEPAWMAGSQSCRATDLENNLQGKLRVVGFAGANSRRAVGDADG